MLVQLRLKSATQYFIVKNQVAESPFTESNSGFYFDLPFKTRNFITAPYPILFIFDKIAGFY